MKTDKELADFSNEHLAYEIQTLWHATSILNSLARQPIDHWFTTAIRNVYLDSFAIHARVLHDFLFSLRPIDDDIVALHYVENWASICPPKTPLLNTLPTKANKQVAHLTYKRIEYEQSGKGWDFTGVFFEILGLLLIFRANARPSSLGQNIVNLLDLLSAKQIQLFNIKPIFSGSRQTGVIIEMLR